MKTNPLFLLLILIALSTPSLCQSIDTASEWRVDAEKYETGQPTLCTVYRDYIDGDTVINSHVYYKVYNTGYCYYYPNPNPNPTNNYFYHYLHGYLREEGNKWYTSDGYNDLLLYDFTLDVGDTVVSAFLYTWAGPVIITAIDSILTDTIYRKRFHLNTGLYQGAEFIIAGMGATTGLFEDMVFYTSQSELICYAKNGVSLWGTSTEECQLNVGLHEKEKKKPGFTVFPNPANDFVTLSLPENRGMIGITLYDAYGRVVRKEMIVANDKMDIQKLTPGLYVFQVNDGVNIHRKTILKM